MTADRRIVGLLRDASRTWVECSRRVFFSSHARGLSLQFSAVAVVEVYTGEKRHFGPGPCWETGVDLDAVIG